MTYYILVNPSPTTEQKDYLKSQIDKSDGLVMVANDEDDTFIVCGGNNDISNREAEICCDALNASLGAKP